MAVETDYTCIPFWEETDCDYYIIPHYELIDEFTAKGIPRERLKPYGIPVRPAFSDQSDRQKARVRCGIPTHAQVYLIMSGSMGFGKIQLFVAELLRTRKPGEYVVVICGNNRRLQKSSLRNLENKKVFRFWDTLKKLQILWLLPMCFSPNPAV